MAAAKNRKLCYLKAEQAFLKADIEKEIYTEIPDEYHKFPGVVGRLNKAIYRFVQAGRCWNKYCNNMAVIGFKQSKADPCVFRKVIDSGWSYKYMTSLPMIRIKQRPIESRRSLGTSSY